MFLEIKSKSDEWYKQILLSSESKTVKFGYAGVTDVESHYMKTKLILRKLPLKRTMVIEIYMCK